MSGPIGYNGWRNRETWLVNIHFNPETKSDVDMLEEELQSSFIDTLEKADHSGYAPFYTDMIDFHCIDWDELRESMEEE